LRARVFSDETLQQELGSIEVSETFAQRAEAAACAHGIDLSQEFVLEGLNASGVARSGPGAPVTATTWPPRLWLPMSAGLMAEGRFGIDWCYFGTEPLAEPFFDLSTRRAATRPLNRLFRCRMRIDDFLANARADESLAPGGFIFHMSRCGSTLAAQMLAAVPENIVISEAPPLDEIVQLNAYWPQLPPDDHARCLGVMIAALGRKRSGNERRNFLKLDSWHILALPLFRRAFPDVPWVFLYRDPVEVLVSQMRQRGLQTIPGSIPARLYGIEYDGRAEDYCARVLAKLCEAAIAYAELGGGLMVNYCELPDALWTRILPHFGVTPDDRDTALMRDVVRRDAKVPQETFVDDTENKQRAASAAIRAAAETHLAPAYRELESMRAKR
jgi:hypothetical protein